MNSESVEMKRSSAIGHTPSLNHDAIDFATFLKSSMTLSGNLDLETSLTTVLQIMLENTGAARGILFLFQGRELRVEAIYIPSYSEQVEVLHAVPMETFPYFSHGLVRQVAQEAKFLVLERAADWEPFFVTALPAAELRPKSVLCLPIARQEDILGVVYLESDEHETPFTKKRLEAAQVLLKQAAISLENARLYTETAALNQRLKKEIEERKQAEERYRNLSKDLEQRVTERTNMLENTQKELLESAHRAGMADIATSVLHNVGNILTSVITSSEIIRNELESFTLEGIVRASRMLAEHADDLEDFLHNNPKGTQLVQYYIKLGKKLEEKKDVLGENLYRLLDKVEIMRDVIIAQHSYASQGSCSEKMFLHDLVEDALFIQENSLSRHEIQIQRLYHLTPAVVVQKTKLINIIINLVKNAKEAMVSLPMNKREVIITTEASEQFAFIKISDNGHGIAKENLAKIFNHGFTTKESGHGFGLHSCANAMSEMGGTMWAESEGPGMGATFLLRFPVPESVSAHFS